MKINVLVFLFLHIVCLSSLAQTKLTIRIIDTESRSVKGASLKMLGSNSAVLSDQNGMAMITLKAADRYVVSHLNYRTDTLAGNRLLEERTIVLQPLVRQIEEVLVQTGYQSISKERSAGSFQVLGKEQLERSNSANLLNRLENITTGLAFVRKDNNGEGEGTPKLRLRGMTTIFGDGSPLIILDNFPFNGNIGDINPEDIATVSVLRDASAASIWGARAGNGVIVLTTKKGSRKPQTFQFYTGLEVASKPNFTQSPYHVNAATFMDMEKTFFDKGWYEQNDWTLNSPYIDRLFDLKNGKITESDLNAWTTGMRRRDFIPELTKKLYRTPVLLRYGLNSAGGFAKGSYYFSVAHQSDQTTIRHNTDAKTNVVANIDYRLTDALTLDVETQVMHNVVKTDGMGISNVIAAGKSYLLPYTSFEEEYGIPKRYSLPYIESAGSNGYLDWRFYPEQEYKFRENRDRDFSFRFNGGLRYKFPFGLDIGFKQLYTVGSSSSGRYYLSNSYESRNLINQYTSPDGIRAIPLGGISNSSGGSQRGYASRLFLSFERNFNDLHQLNLFAGVERNESVLEGNPTLVVYGINDQTRIGASSIDFKNPVQMSPQGNWSYIPAPDGRFMLKTDRYEAYYANMGYTFDRRYTATASVRVDKCNLFGVNFNQKRVPLWSTGLLWNVKAEQWFKSSLLSALKLRTTIGENGNVDKTLTAYPIATYSNDSFNGFIRGTLANTGNPSLQWEKIRTLNLGLDFGLLNNRIVGQVEFYNKWGRDLIGDAIVDPTTGIDNQVLRNRINYANALTRGFDVDLTIQAIKQNQFNWMSNVILGYVSNKITKYNDGQNGWAIASYLGQEQVFSPPQVDKPQNYLYSYKWNGLDNEGDPVVYLTDGTVSKNYAAYLQGLVLSDLVYAGNTVPTWFGSWRNTFNIAGRFNLSFLLSFKAGYVYRRPSLSYYSLLNNWMGHIEMQDRWQQVGDENHTSVPGLPKDLASMTQRDMVYQMSERTVESGAHIRMEDIQFAYTFPWKNRLFKKVDLSFNVKNLGILWSKSKEHIDPDMPLSFYARPLQASMLLRVDF
jgi:TonB-linked SusC/RagA family outer membrane protein